MVSVRSRQGYSGLQREVSSTVALVLHLVLIYTNSRYNNARHVALILINNAYTPVREFICYHKLAMLK